MRYYLTAVKRMNDNTEARECLGMDDLIVAKSVMYRKQSIAMDDLNCVYAFGVVHNEMGQQMDRPVSFTRPTVDEVTE